MQYSLKRIAFPQRAYKNLYTQKTYFLYIQCTIFYTSNVQKLRLTHLLSKYHTQNSD